MINFISSYSFFFFFFFQAEDGIRDYKVTGVQTCALPIYLACLARNVYFEARGEPAAGQYAVAEVTMNRKASRRFPRTVCAVVYQKNWDPILGRHVGAFSWTEFNELPAPSGEEWERALKVAEAVYYRRYTPVLEGALFFHATYITPDWAKEKKRVARIGRHVFYR